MSEISYTNWYAKSDRALLEDIGAFVRHHRMEMEMTQSALAEAAGIGRSTLSLLERGESVALMTLIHVLRVLGRLDILEPFVLRPEVSPLELADAELKKRMRVRNKRS